MKLKTLKQIYDQALIRMQQEPEYWKGFLEYASNMYAYEFPTLASLYAQNQENIIKYIPEPKEPEQEVYRLQEEVMEYFEDFELEQ